MAVKTSHVSVKILKSLGFSASQQWHGNYFQTGAHHNRYQPRVPSNPIFSSVLGHYFHPFIFLTKKHLLTSEAFCLSLQLSEESTFAAASNKGLSAK